jgi:hypothetical protein
MAGCIVSIRDLAEPVVLELPAYTLIGIVCPRHDPREHDQEYVIRWMVPFDPRIEPVQKAFEPP